MLLGGRLLGVVPGGNPRLQARQHLVGPQGDRLLAIGQVLGRQPPRRLERPVVLQANATAAHHLEAAGVLQQLGLVLRQGLHHLDRVVELLPCPLELGKRGVCATVGPLAFESPQPPAAVAQRLARLLQVVLEVLQLDQPQPFLVAPLFLGLVLDEAAFLRGEVENGAGLGLERPLLGCQVLELFLEPERIGRGTLGVHQLQQPANTIPQPALVVDHAIEPCFERVSLVQLIGELLDPAQHQLEVDPGVGVAFRRQPDGVVEPGA